MNTVLQFEDEMALFSNVSRKVRLNLSHNLVVLNLIGWNFICHYFLIHHSSELGNFRGLLEYHTYISIMRNSVLIMSKILSMNT